MPHEKFETVTDRLFWLQRVQNVVIFTTTGRALYAGFADIALDLFKFFEGDLSYCFWRGCRKTEEEQDEVIKFLVEEIRKKDRNVLF